MNTPQLAVRLPAKGENHHLWNNHGTYWCHFTVHLPDYTKRRVRLSLKTTDPAEARRRRDDLLARLKAGAGLPELAPAHQTQGRTVRTRTPQVFDNWNSWP